MIFYGSRSDTLFLAEMPMHACTRCTAVNSLQLFVNYESAHLFWLFGMVLHREYLAQCSSCRAAVRMDKHEIASLITHDPIPFMERWGLAIFLASIALLVVVFAPRPSF